jgi:hypothetical protein
VRRRSLERTREVENRRDAKVTDGLNCLIFSATKLQYFIVSKSSRLFENRFGRAFVLFQREVKRGVGEAFVSDLHFLIDNIQHPTSYFLSSTSPKHLPFLFSNSPSHLLVSPSPQTSLPNLLRQDIIHTTTNMQRSMMKRQKKRKDKPVPAPVPVPVSLNSARAV